MIPNKCLMTVCTCKGFLQVLRRTILFFFSPNTSCEFNAVRIVFLSKAVVQTDRVKPDCGQQLAVNAHFAFWVYGSRLVLMPDMRNWRVLRNLFKVNNDILCDCATNMPIHGKCFAVYCVSVCKCNRNRLGHTSLFITGMLLLLRVRLTCSQSPKASWIFLFSQF